MKGITLTDELVSQIVGKPATKISESQETVGQGGEHVCPLCESHLEEPISEEKIQEHVDYFLEVINENFDIVGDDLDEDEENSDEDAEDLDEEEGLEEGEDLDEGELSDEDVDESSHAKYSALFGSRAKKQGRKMTDQEKAALQRHSQNDEKARARIAAKK